MSGNNKTNNRHNILSGMVSMLLGIPLVALAGPEGEQVIHGGADIVRPNSISTIIQQHTQNVLLDWQSFDIDANEQVLFQQPGSESIAVNRVVGGSPTEIFGQLQANGQVFILNTQGVYFAPTAQLDVHGLVAAAGTISSTDFLTGKYRISNITGNVTNAGNIQANSGGYIMLAGERVENTGTLNVSNGDIALAAGRQVTVNIAGDELIGFTVDEAALGTAAGIHNAGDIIGDGGMVVLEARTAGDLASAAINQQGRIRANSTSIENGRIMLRARGGDIAVSGELDADGINGADGGRMLVHSDRNITVTKDARLHADGVNGGTVRAIAEKDLDLQIGSELSTQNIAATGKGGFIEASGHETFNLEGDIRTGDGGTFLIDPTDVTIVAGTASSGTAIGADYIEGLLDSNVNVVIVASNSISVDETITAMGGDGDLTLTIGTIASGCGGDPVCTGTSSINFVGDGAITVSAGAPIVIRGTLIMNAQDGTITLEDDIESFAEFVRLDAGPLSVGAQYDGVINTGTATQSDISIEADDHIILLAGDLVELGQLSSASGGTISITVNGNTRANSGLLNLAAAAPGGNAASTTGQLIINLDGGNDSAIMNIDGNLRGGANVNIAQDGGSASAIATINGYIESVNGQATAALNGGAGGGHFTVNGVNGSGESMKAKNSVGVTVTGDPNAATSAATINLAGGMRTDAIGGIGAATLRAEHTAANATGGSGATIDVGGDVFGRSFGIVETKVGSLTGGDITLGDYSSNGNVNLTVSLAAVTTASPTVTVGALSSTNGNVTATLNRGSLVVTSPTPATVPAIQAANQITINAGYGNVTINGDIKQTNPASGWVAIDAGNAFTNSVGNITVNGNIDLARSAGIPGADVVISGDAAASGANISIAGSTRSNNGIDIQSTIGNVNTGNLTVNANAANASITAGSTGSGSVVSVGNIQATNSTGNISTTLQGDSITATGLQLTAPAGNTTSTALDSTGASGFVNVTGNMSSIADSAAGTVLLQGAHDVDGKVTLSGNTVTTAADAPLSAGFLQVSANTAIGFQNTVTIGTLTSTTAPGDNGLDTALVTNGLTAIGHTANAHLSAQSIDFQDIVLNGDYVYMAANDISIGGTVAVNGASPIVQIAPTLAANSMGFDGTTPGGQDSNFLWAGQLDKIDGHTLILGSTSHAGDAFLGSTGAIDIGNTNLLILTSGSVTGFDRLTSTGVIGDISGRVNGPAPVPATPTPIAPSAPPSVPVAAGIFETPLVDEIEDDSDEDENDTVKAGEGTDGDSDSSGQGITHRTAPETLECSI